MPRSPSPEPATPPPGYSVLYPALDERTPLLTTPQQHQAPQHNYRATAVFHIAHHEHGGRRRVRDHRVLHVVLLLVGIGVVAAAVPITASAISASTFWITVISTTICVTVTSPTICVTATSTTICVTASSASSISPTISVTASSTSSTSPTISVTASSTSTTTTTTTTTTTSAAAPSYHVAKLCREYSIPVSITIYERSSHLGGRGTHPITLPTGDIFDLAATTIASDSYLGAAVRALHIPTTHHPAGAPTALTSESPATFGVYDGRSWAQQSSDRFFSTWWDAPELKRLIATAQSAVHHDPAHHPLAAGTAEELFPPAIAHLNRHLLNPWTRAAHAQNLGTISALAALLAVAPPEQHITLRDSPGTLQPLWEGMVHAANATLHLDTPATALWQTNGSWHVDDSDAFDDVVLAAPASLAGLYNAPPAIDTLYTPLYTTLFLSPSRLSGHMFHGAAHIPDVVLSTPCTWEWDYLSGRSGAAGLGAPRFWSLVRVRTVIWRGQRHWLYRLTGPEKFDAGYIQALVGVGQPVAWRQDVAMDAGWALVVPREGPVSGIGGGENGEDGEDGEGGKKAKGRWYASGMEETAAGVDAAAVRGVEVAEAIVAAWRRDGAGAEAHESMGVLAVAAWGVAGGVGLLVGASLIIVLNGY
ncbi:hypothetical protein EDC01DRAFT_776067 [Geopyxis carbonaria]|nr:hypothetical protein EDC01DRAFT_776067 [Geopyxis carbonaria]